MVQVVELMEWVLVMGHGASRGGGGDGGGRSEMELVLIPDYYLTSFMIGCYLSFR